MHFQGKGKEGEVIHPITNYHTSPYLLGMFSPRGSDYLEPAEVSWWICACKAKRFLRAPTGTRPKSKGINTVCPWETSQLHCCSCWAGSCCVVMHIIHIALIIGLSGCYSWRTRSCWGGRLGLDLVTFTDIYIFSPYLSPSLTTSHHPLLYLFIHFQCFCVSWRHSMGEQISSEFPPSWWRVSKEPTHIRSIRLAGRYLWCAQTLAIDFSSSDIQGESRKTSTPWD